MADDFPYPAGFPHKTFPGGRKVGRKAALPRGGASGGSRRRGRRGRKVGTTVRLPRRRAAGGSSR